MGGLVSVRAADLAPDRIARLVLTAPAAMAADQLPEAVGWQTIGRLAVLLGTPVARAVLRWSARPVLAKLAALRDSTRRPAAASISPEGDPRRLSAELIGVWADDLTAVRAHPERLARSATALASAMWAMFIDQRPTLALLDRLDVPVLLWGSDDPLADDVTCAVTPAGRVGRPASSRAPGTCCRSRCQMPTWPLSSPGSLAREKRAAPRWTSSTRVRCSDSAAQPSRTACISEGLHALVWCGRRRSWASSGDARRG